jgi:hypothetical protein
MSESSEVPLKPTGYVEPATAWLVECRHPGETEPGLGVLQLGALTSQPEAERLLAVAPDRYGWVT